MEKSSLKKEALKKKILWSLGKGDIKSAQEVWGNYLKNFPPNLLFKSLNIFVSVDEVEKVLIELSRLGYVTKEIFSVQGVREPLVCYRMSEAGAEYLGFSQRKRRATFFGFGSKNNTTSL